MTLIFAAFFASASIPMYFVVSELVSGYYPKYIEILPFLPLIFFAFVVRSCDFISNIYVIIDKPQYVVLIQCVYALVVLLLIGNSMNLVDLSNPLFYFGLNVSNAVIPVILILLTLGIRRK
jgi:hypothetical protein